MKNLISHNISYLLDFHRLTQKEFSDLFSLPTSAVNAYVNNKSLPKIATILKICKHFSIEVGDFITSDLKNIKTEIPSMEEALQMQANEAAGIYGEGPVVEMLRERLNDKDKIIKILEREIERLQDAVALDRGNITSKLSRLIEGSEDSEQLEAAIVKLSIELQEKEKKAQSKLKS